MIPLSYQVVKAQVAQLVDPTTPAGLTGQTTALKTVAVSNPGAATVTFVA
jgi:hypothetical protein